MASVFSISVWFALVTAIPGLVTMAVVYGAVILTRPELEVPAAFDEGGAWVWTAVVVTVMVLTQAFGILLEEKILIPGQRLGDAERERKVGRGIDPLGTEERFTINAYEEYLGMWVLLAHLDENDDSQGHLKRAAAQFFLTVNTLVSFMAGVIACLILVLAEPSLDVLLRSGLYAAGLLALLWISFEVAKSRFDLMAWSLWAARRRKLQAMAGKEAPSS